jgi:hypothetical protein
MINPTEKAMEAWKAYEEAMAPAKISSRARILSRLSK